MKGEINMNTSNEMPYGIVKRQVDLMGRITIPADYRKDLNINIGDNVEIILYSDMVVIRPCSRQSNL